MASKTNHLEKLKQFKNVDLVQINYEDESSLEAAFQDVRCTILITENNKHRVEYSKKVLCAMKKMNVKTCMMISVEGAEKSNSEALRCFHEIEKEVQNACSECYLILRKSLLSQSLLLLSSWVREHSELILSCAADCKMTTLDLCDLDCAIDTIVIESCCEGESGDSKNFIMGFGRHQNKTYTLTGPQIITPKYITEEISKVTDSEIKFKEVSREKLRECLESILNHDLAVSASHVATAGDHHEGDHEHPHFELNDTIIELLLDELDLVKHGRTGFVSDDFEKVTGRQGKPVSEFLRKEKDAFKPDRV
ncbi:hypothetical protein BG011_005814 [Mortierella polycephala]|uniref:NAD(P)-binding domain-containing protein n=1 Tax=Mortierella polycephala TaxID=41804 RepID=A0A9P6PWU0_9FUNG|nr:hypothetical protein BG011_005814 [Mortierella polycephala]